MRRLVFGLLVFICSLERIHAEYYSYKHYSRHPTYDNRTMMNNEDDSNMCHLSVRCPAIPALCKMMMIERKR
mgnify:FL=1